MAQEEKDQELIEEALTAYNIPKEWVLASRVDKEQDAAVIVTHGGKKIIHKRGEKAKFKLTITEIAGILPDEKMYWSHRLQQGIRISELKEK